MCMWVSVAPGMRSGCSAMGSSCSVLRIMPQQPRQEVVMECLRLDIDDGVAVVTLNRPESMNALNVELREATLATARALDTNDDVNAVVFTGAGDQALL